MRLRRGPTRLGTRHAADPVLMCWSWLVFALVLCACADNRGGPASAVAVVDTIAGVVHVRNGAPVTVDSVEAAVVIGESAGLSEATPDAFGRVNAATISEDGRIFVADALAHEVRVFSADGEFLQNVGREGEGPGEFSSLYSLAWVGDTLLALDPGNARISTFASNGAVLGTWPWFPLTGPVNAVRFYTTGRSETYVFGPGRPGSRLLPYVRLRASGAVDALGGAPT